MALFNTKKENKEEAGVQENDSAPKNTSQKESFSGGKTASVLIGPRITEKATDSQQRNVYVFEISPRSNKVEVSEAIQELYKVKPVRVNIVKNPSKITRLRGKKGSKNGVKKAYVFLKEGDRIELL